MGTTLLGPFVIARLSGRCANGAERDGGRRLHVIEEDSVYGRAVCGARPGKRSNGWDEVDGAETPTCPRCLAKAANLDNV